MNGDARILVMPHGGLKPPAAEVPLRVTKRQAEVIELRRKLTRRDVALVLGVSENTVKKHLRRAYEVLGAESITDAYCELMTRRAA